MRRTIIAALATFVFTAPAMARSEERQSMTTPSFTECQKVQQEIMRLVTGGRDWKLVPWEGGAVALFLQIDGTIAITCSSDGTAEIYATGVATNAFPGFVRAFELLK